MRSVFCCEQQTAKDDSNGYLLWPNHVDTSYEMQKEKKIVLNYCTRP